MERIKEQVRISRKIYFIILGIAIFLRIAMTSRLTPSIFADMQHDDLWLVERANSILNGHWLGEYNQYTLLKGVFSPLFLAFSYIVGMDYMEMCTYVYVISCIIFLIAVSKLISKERYCVKIALFIILLYNPISYAQQTFQRIYRNGMSQWQVLLIFSATIAIIYELDNGVKKIVPWIVIDGIALWSYVNTREDGAWVLIFAVCSAVATYLVYAIQQKKFMCVKYAWVFAPLIILILGNIAVKVVNYSYYGVWEQNDRTQGYFAAVMGDLYQIKAGDEKYAKDNNIYINIYYEALEKAYKVSPTMESIKPNLEQSITAWDGIDTIRGDGELETDHLLFALRDAVKASGYYSDGKETEQFYKQIHQELSNGFREGALEKRGISITGNSVPLKFSMLPNIFVESWNSLKTVITFKDVQCSDDYVSGSGENIGLFERISGDYGLKGDLDNIKISGWIFYLDNDMRNIQYVFCDKEGNVLQLVDFSEDTDVYDYFESNGLNYENARRCRFNNSISNVTSDNEVLLNAYIDSQLVYQLQICGDGVTAIQDNTKILYNIDSVSYYSQKQSTGEVVEKVNSVIEIYQKGGGVLWWVAFGAYVALGGVFLKTRKRDYGIPLLISTGTFLSLVLFLFCVSYIHITTFYARHYLYLSTGYILYLIFGVFTIGVVLDHIVLPKMEHKKLDGEKGNA